MQPFNTNLFLKMTMPDYNNKAILQIRPAVVCEDGFAVSIQASAAHYCTPRVNGAPRYETVELGFPSESDPLIFEYAEDPKYPTRTVYAQVPVEVVDTLIEKHGGVVDVTSKY